MISFWLLVRWSISIGYSLTNKRKLLFSVILGFFGGFWPFLPYFSKMTEFNQFIFSGTLIHPNICRLRLFRTFSDAWFTQNKFLTELNSPISGVHFSFATIFYCLNFVRFCSYSELKLSYGSSLQWRKPFVDIFFHL